MEPTSLENRVDLLERQMEGLAGLPARVGSLEVQVVQLRADMNSGFSALRADMRADMAVMREELRAEIRAGDDETRRFMRVLHEEVLAQIRLIGEK